METQWVFDGEFTNFQRIIREAKERYGYDPEDGIHYAPEAARILRANGHQAEQWVEG